MKISEEDTRRWIACLKWIKERIDDGTYPNGTWLPRVDEICSALNLSTIPVRHALSELGGMQIITQVYGTGWYVGNGEPPQEASPAMIKRRRRGYGGQEPSPSPAGENKYGWGSGRQGPKEPDPFLAEESYISCAEFAAMLRVANMTIYRLIHSGEVKGVIRVGKTLRIPVSGARKFLEKAKEFDLDDLSELADDE